MKARVTLDDGTVLETEIDVDQLTAIQTLIASTSSCSHEYPDPWPTVNPPDCTKCGVNYVVNQET